MEPRPEASLKVPRMHPVGFLERLLPGDNAYADLRVEPAGSDEAGDEVREHGAGGVRGVPVLPDVRRGAIEQASLSTPK